MRLNSMRLAVSASLVLASAASAQIVSTFDADDEGWGTLNDARNFTWTDALGNPAGAIRATDATNGQIWYFSAPSAFLGNQSSFYGGSLSWDVLGITGNQTSIVDRADIMLTGGGLQLGVDLDVLPLTSGWTSWMGLIDASADWKLIDSFANGTLTATDATEGDLRTVLGSLDGLYIRGEYTNGADASAIDNVNLVPSPSALAMLGLGALGAARRRR